MQGEGDLVFVDGRGTPTAHTCIRRQYDDIIEMRNRRYSDCNQYDEPFLPAADAIHVLL